MSNTPEHKLYHFEVKPSDKNWEAINNALDEQDTSFAKRLYNFEQLPPEKTWKEILPVLENLNQSQTAQVTALHNRFSKTYKYLIAASVFIIASVAVVFYLKKDEVSSNEVVQSSTSVPNTESIASPETTATAVTTQPIEKATGNNNKKIDVENQNETPATTRQIASRYVTMADDEGHEVRLSKKAYNVFNCAENTAAINYERCKENIQSMQQKMSATLLSPSGDFAGLIDMIKTLEEN